MNRLVASLLIIACYLIGFVESNRPGECDLQHEVGPCRAAIPAYYYDPSLDKCVFFYYGGCGGNENRFETEAGCQAQCGNNQKNSEKKSMPYWD